MNSTEYFVILLQTNIEEDNVGGRENFTERKLRPPQAAEPAKLGEEPQKLSLVFQILNCYFVKTCLGN